MPRRDYNLEWMLRDWYGSDRGRSEIAGKLPEPRPIADLLDHAVQRCLSAERLKILRIRDAWPDLAGESNAKRSTPVSLREKILYVEISHPAYRMAMDNLKIKNFILERLNGLFNETICEKILFIPAGGRRS